MKKALSILLSVLLLLALVPTGAVPVSAWVSGYLTYEYVNNEAIITKCDTSVSGDLTIPKTLGGCPVTTIGSSAFSGCTRLSSITIPDSVTSIGNNAFYNCTQLRSVYISDIAAWCAIAFDGYYANPLYRASQLFLNGTVVKDLVIPDGVTTIKWGAFFDCNSLTSVTIPDSVTTIEAYAFRLCSNVTAITVSETNPNYCDVDGVLFNKDKTTLIQYPGDKSGDYTIPDSVTAIGDYAFHAARKLTSVTIPGNVITIGSYAFWECKALTSVVVLDGVTSIGSSAFSDCSKLSSITLPDSVTSLGVNAFSNTGYYNDVDNWDNGNVLYIDNYLISAKKTISGDYIIREGTVLIVASAFSSCTGLTSVTIPDSVTTIGMHAFYLCSSLTSVNIGNSVTAIERDTFYNCSSLASVNIGNSVTAIGDRAFFSCKKLTSVTIPDSVTTIGMQAFSNCSSLTTVAIPNSVTTIGDRAFYNCSSLISVTIPDSVTTIGKWAFYNCSSLTSVNITDVAAWCDLEFASSSDNPLYYAKNLYLNGELVTNLVIPEGVTTIGDYAFYNCSSLISVTIPDSVTTIGDYAFDCNQLKNVYYGGAKIDREAITIGFGNFYLTYATWHYHEHVYDNVCDLDCNDCGFVRTDAPHVYDTICDVECSDCGFVRTNAHLYDNACDTDCNQCGAVREVSDHVYNNIGDATCNACGDVRESVSGSTGAWTYNYGTNTLVVFWGGAQKEWLDLRKDVVIFEEGIRHIGGDSFAYTYGDVGVLVIPSTLTSVGSETFMCGARTVILDSPTIAANAKTYDSVGYLFFHNNTTLVNDSIANVGSYITKQYKETITVNGTVYHMYSDCYHQFKDITSPDFTGQYCTSCHMPRDAQLSEGGFTYALNGDGAIVTGYTQSLPADLVIPDTLGGHPVTAIGVGAFESCSGLTSVTIPDSVTAIGNWAFSDCTGLTSVATPNNLVSIGAGAFYGCESLTSVTIPNRVTIIKRYAFFDCDSLISVTIGNSITTIEENAFSSNSNNNKLKDVYYSGSEEGRAVISIASPNSNLTGATWHYDMQIVGEHVYVAACDNVCAVCGAVREAEEPHVYDNACDADCNGCGGIRDVPDHVYDYACDADCNVCGALREVGDHEYDHACDADCNVCDAIREVGDHVYDNDKDADCNECGAIREVVTVLLGDVNGDGRVNNRDLGLFQQYLADMDVTIDMEVANVNGDSRVNNRDLGLLQQYLADMNVTLG